MWSIYSKLLLKKNNNRGIEHVFKKEFANYDIKTRVGYTGGNTESPDYKEVCTGTTNHAEALDITFDPAKVSYETLLEFFFRVHGTYTSL